MRAPSISCLSWALQGCAWNGAMQPFPIGQESGAQLPETNQRIYLSAYLALSMCLSLMVVSDSSLDTDHGRLSHHFRISPAPARTAAVTKLPARRAAFYNWAGLFTKHRGTISGGWL